MSLDSKESNGSIEKRVRDSSMGGPIITASSAITDSRLIPESIINIELQQLKSQRDEQE